MISRLSTKNIALICIGLGVAFTLIACGEPSKKTCRQAILLLVAEKVPSTWLGRHLEPIESTMIDEVKIISVGVPKTRETRELVPVEARIDGYYSYTRIGESWPIDRSFSETCKFDVYKDETSIWRAEYQNPSLISSEKEENRITLFDGSITTPWFSVEVDALEKKSSTAWNDFRSLMIRLADFYNEVFHQKKFRDREEFEPPGEYERGVEAFWEGQRDIYSKELKRLKIPILKLDKALSSPSYTIFRIMTHFEMDSYDFRTRSFPLRVELKNTIGDRLAYNTSKGFEPGPWSVLPIPVVVGYFSSVSLREPDLEQAEQLRESFERDSLKMFLDCGIYAIAPDLIKVAGNEFAFSPLVLQFLSGRIYNSKTDPDYETPVLTWKMDKEPHLLYDIFNRKSVNLEPKFGDSTELPIKLLGGQSFPVLNNDGWHYWGPGGWLGVGSDGVRITRVVRNSPAQKVGILPGDTIVEFNNIPVHTFVELKQLLADSAPETRVTIKFQRGERYFKRNVVLGKSR